MTKVLIGTKIPKSTANSFIYVDENKKLADALPALVENTTTSITGTEVKYDFQSNINPTSNTDLVLASLRGRATMQGSSDMVAFGHIIGAIGEGRHEGTGTLDRTFAVEGRIDNVDTGIMDKAMSFAAVLGINTGTVNNYYAFWAQNLSGLSGVTNKYSLYSADPYSILFNNGSAIFGGKLTTGTSVDGIFDALELSYTNNITSGAKISWAVEQTTETGNIEHQLISGSATETRFSIYDNGLVQIFKLDPAGITIGNGVAGKDYTLIFNGETNDGVLTWMEDESIFDFNSGININGVSKIGDGGTTDYIQFAIDGKTTLHGTARVKRHIHLFSNDVKKGVNPPGEATIGNTPVLQFSNIQTEEVYFIIHIPVDWDDTTDINFHIHWSPVDGTSGDVVWKMDYKISKAENNEVISGTDATLSVTDSTQSLQDEHLKTSDVSISSSVLEQYDKISVRLYRDTNDSADTYGADASLLFLEMLYISNKLGETI